MERSIKIVLVVTWIFILTVYTCQSKKNKQETATRYSTSLTGGVFFDTLLYDDGNLINAVDSVHLNDRYGVWFSPKRDSVHTSCSLVGIQYLFGDTLDLPIDSVIGFVNRASLYPNDSLPHIIGDRSLVTFKFLPRPEGQVTTIYLSEIGKSLAVQDSIDFLIGWITADSSLFPIGLGDSIANYTPVRSYQWQSGDSIPHSLPFDLGVRAIFECEKSLPDSGNFMFELHWGKKNTDLDLYLIMPIAQDTIGWFKKISTSGKGHLDVDDNDGYGPEKIVQLYNSAFQDTSAQLYVNYYGPAKGKVTKSMVYIHRNTTHPYKIGPCNLKPKDWWHVANINLKNGYFEPDTSCTGSPNPKLSERRKR